jgi:hypothetical protein
MPNKWTFEVHPLAQIIKRYKAPGECWIDPFSGFHSPAEVTNDLNPEAPSMFHLEAIEFLRRMDGPFDGAIFDPPYSIAQVSQNYQSFGLQFKGSENPTGGFPKVRDRLAAIVKPGGYVISYGWNSTGMGKERGFELIEVLLCCHGGNRHDTIVTVERRALALQLHLF